MGNCLKSNYNKVLAEEDYKLEEPKKELAEAISMKKGQGLSTTSQVQNDIAKGNKNRVRLRFQEGENQESDRSGVVRIKMVVTQEELKQILSYKSSRSAGASNFSSLEQLLSEMKLRGRSAILEDHNNSNNGSWSPTLESIPEDH